MLVDPFGRPLHYLRLSVEDACNSRSVYGRPGRHRGDPEPPLSVVEIRRLVAAFAGLGFWKVRLTGGEPTLRGDIVEIVRTVAGVPGVRCAALTTNGYRLAGLARELKDAGLSAVNVGVDSLERARFAQLAGRDKLPAVLAGVDACVQAGIAGVKVNVVLMRGVNDAETDAFLERARATPVTVRFIELMRTEAGSDLFERRHLPAPGLVTRLLDGGWKELPRRPGDGPARRFAREGDAGEVGVVAPDDPGFCSNCNRLRVDSRGRLRLCRFAEPGPSLRQWLASEDDAQALQSRVRELVARKEASHGLREGRLGEARKLAAGGD